MNEPNPTDPILSTNPQTPTDGAILGGEAGKQQRLRSPNYRNYRFCRRFAHPACPILMSHDNRYFYEIDNRNVRRIDIQTGELIHELPPVKETMWIGESTATETNTVYPTHLALSHDGCLLAVAHTDMTASLWRIDSSKPEALLVTFEKRHPDAQFHSNLSAIAFAANDEYLFAVSNGYLSYEDTALWMLKPLDTISRTRGRISGYMPHPFYGTTGMIAASADGSVLVGKQSDSSIEVAQFVCSSKQKRDTISPIFPDSSNIRCLAVSPDNQWLAVGSENALRLGHIETLNLREPISIASVNRLVFAPDSQTLIGGGRDGRIEFWDVPSGETCGSLPRSEDPVSSLVSSRDGTILLVYSKPKDEMGFIEVWELAK
ncbi:MAG: hypothetical protein AAGA60_23705 [Cyanobacteria bacterium P01_E01_bin.42]